jgi:hypothetical protein
MLQIKTIKEKTPEHFDKLVNEALADGWTLTRRESQVMLSLYLAELEKVVITEAEKTCDNCKHCDAHPEAEPCASCSEDCDKWEAWE